MKILQVKKEVAQDRANAALPNPLIPKERVIAAKDQSGVPRGYVRLKRPCLSLETSVFSLNHFIILK